MVCEEQTMDDRSDDEEELRSTVIGYLRNLGYLTEGFVGGGTVRVDFEEECTESVVVGVKECGEGNFSAHEIVAVEIDKEDKSEADFVSAANHASEVSANKCFIAKQIHFDEDDKEIASQFGIGLLEVEAKKVKEVVPPRVVKSRATTTPKLRSDGLKVACHLLKLTEKDLEHLARVFCRAKHAWLGFAVAGVSVELGKQMGTLKIEITICLGPLKKTGTYTFKFGELAGFIVKEGDDRYTFIEKLGNMFIFRPSEWMFMLRVLSRVDKCFLVFSVGISTICFSRHPCQQGLDLKMNFNDDRDCYYEHHYSQEHLRTLTRKGRRKGED